MVTKCSILSGSCLRMDYSKTYILKVNFDFPANEKQLYRALEEIKDRENGKVMVLGNVDPYTLRLALEMAGTKAKISWEHNPTVNNPQNNSAEVAQPTSAQAFSPHTDAQMAQVHQLSLIKGLEQVEVITHSKSFSMMFNGNKDDSSQRNQSQSTDVNATQTSLAAGPSTGTGSSNGHGHLNTHYQCHNHEVAVLPNANVKCNGCGPACMSSCIPPAPPAYNHYAPMPPPPPPPPPPVAPLYAIFS